MDTSSSNSKTNERWMSSEELKGEIHSLKKDQKAAVAKLKRTQENLAKLIEEESILVPLDPTPVSSRRSHSSSLRAGSAGEGEV